MMPSDPTGPARRAPPRPNRRVSAGLRDRLGDNLWVLRRARGLTQIELAALCHCNHRLISNLENGLRNATLATLEMLAVALNCCESDLLSRSPAPPRTPAAQAHVPGHQAAADSVASE
jgi:transcriptional regulator with XRE-family HTH domain